jgi:hypothetical protein
MNKNNNGQAVMVLVMVVAIVSLIFTHVALLNINALKLSNELYESAILRTKAEGYLEDTAMQFLRNIDFGASGPILLNEGDISCTIEVTDLGGFSRDFESTCVRGSRSKKVGMQVAIASGVFTFTKITER